MLFTTILSLSILFSSEIDSAMHKLHQPIIKEEKILTPIDKVDLAKELYDAHLLVNRFEPSINRLAASWAQVALENGQGKFVYNHNLGNIGPFKGQAYYHHSNLTTYRSFSSFVDGGKAYWNTLNRCKLALKQFDNGDMESASYTLYRCNYYGADPKLYSKIMKELFLYAKLNIIPRMK